MAASEYGKGMIETWFRRIRSVTVHPEAKSNKFDESGFARVAFADDDVQATQEGNIEPVEKPFLDLDTLNMYGEASQREGLELRVFSA